jgi:hypothetical protein
MVEIQSYPDITFSYLAYHFYLFIYCICNPEPCVDAKVGIDSNALYRLPEVAALRDKSQESIPTFASTHKISPFSRTESGLISNNAKSPSARGNSLLEVYRNLPSVLKCNNCL